MQASEIQLNKQTKNLGIPRHLWRGNEGEVLIENIQYK